VAGICGYGEELSGSINAGNFLTSCKVYWLASQEGLCSMELVAVRYTGRPLTQSDYTRSCIRTVALLRMSTGLLETCRGFK